MTEALALALLGATILTALLRPAGVSEVAVAGGAAIVLLATGGLSLSGAGREAAALAPTLGFLAAVLVLGELAEREGVFAAAGRLMARRARGRPQVLLALTFGVAAAVTAVLSLDATVVLLTPVVFATAAAQRLRPRPHVYACVHLANSASLLLPVSNLTNLLAFHAARISFARFAALMALPWLAVLAVEWAVLRRHFASDLVGRGSAGSPGAPARSGRFGAAVLTATLGGLALSSVAGIDPAWVAAAGAATLAVPALLSRRLSPAGLARAAGPSLLVFVLCLSFVVRAADVHGLGPAVDSLLPAGDALPALLAVAALSALLANLVNNLPAILILTPVLAPAGAGPLLAALIGVNVGPNLTYAGSLATLLWRRALHAREAEPDIAQFVRLGALTVPPALVAGTLSLWLALHVVQ